MMPTDEKPYGDIYHAELERLYEAQNRAAQTYTSQTLYLRHQMYSRNDALRKQAAEEAAAEWLRLDAAISALNAAEYRKKQAAQASEASRWEECDGPCCRYPIARG